MGALRARDIRVVLRGVVDDRVIKTMEQLAEQQHQLDKGLGEVVLLVNKMADITSDYVKVAEQMKKTVDAYRLPQDEVTPGTTQ